ncbi:MAG: DUF1453 domain-containing protein [Rhodanobacteraceae bacterium]
MSPNVIAPIVIAPLIVWRLYARLRRNFGRQLIRPKRMWTRVAILSVLIVLFSTQGIRNPLLAEWLIAGLVAGLALGWLGLRFTRFEIDGSKDCYVPNPWIGLVLTTLLLARLLYRFMVIWPEMSHMGTPMPGAWHHSPLTMAFFGLWFGYYIAYYAGLLLHHRRALTDIRSKQPAS